ncbi:MAG: hypothetical protein FVQ85_04535 [Planctomycetes bacterium]|nr:hypothetical protein [Planctomycetota bacterium]
MKKRTKKKHKEYPQETEAAWFVIKEFVAPLLCSFKINKSAIPFNTNELLNHHFSGTGVFTSYFYGKGKYHLHIFQVENHYFRCNYNAKHSTGYHRADKIAQKSVLNNILGINTKREDYDGYYVILCKVDIDGHNEEKDCNKVAIWLNTTHFKQSYWEPSTSFSGKHGYIKIAIPIGTPLEEVHNILNRLFKILDIKRELLGYKAPIDSPCGLPSIVTWDNTIETPKDLPKISYQEYKDFRSLREKIKELKKAKEIDKLEQLNLQISENFHYNDILKIVKTPVPASIKSSQCGKLPRFNRTHGDRPSLDDIRFFYNLEYYEFSHLVELLNTLENDPDILSYVPSPSPSSTVDISVSSNKDSSLPDIPIIYKDGSTNPVGKHVCSSGSSHSFLSSSDLPITPTDLPIGPSICFPSQEKNVVSLSSDGENENSIYVSTTTTPRNYCLGKLRSKANNKDFKSNENVKNEKNEEISNNANRRTGTYITSFLRDYYRANNTVPTVEEEGDTVCDGYRKKYGTGGEDKYDRKRIISLLEKCIKSFKPELVGGKPKYHRFMFIPSIKETFVRAEYKDILKDTGARKYRPNNVILDLFGGYLLTHLSRNKELTLSTYDGFKKFCKNYGVKVDDNRCLACRLLFEHYGWLEKIDPDYEMPRFDLSDWKLVKVKGRSMAYTLTPQFPYYEEFEKSVDKKDIDKARNKGMRSLQDWDNMEITG